MFLFLHNASKTAGSFLAIVLTIAVLSCKDKDPAPRDYAWTTTDAIPAYSEVHKMRITGGLLHMAGTVNGKMGIFKFDGTSWIKMVETAGFADDFVYYNNVLYYGNSFGLFRVVNGVPEKFTVNDPYITALEVFNDKLIISGGSIVVGSSSKYAATASYDGTTFESISEFSSANSMIVANGVLLMARYPIIQYDGQNLTSLSIGGQSNITVDVAGSIYIAAHSIDSKNQVTSAILKYANGQPSMVGDSIKASISKVLFFDNTLVASGFKSNQGISLYLRNGVWKEAALPNAIPLGDMIVYSGRMVGTPQVSTQAIELK